MVARSRRRQKTEVRRAEIADAAGAVMLKRGSEHITIKEIAKEIRLSEGAIYRHFQNKRDILSLMVEHAEESLSNDFERSFRSGRPPLEVLERALQKHVSSIERRKGVSFQVIAEIVSLGDKGLNRQASEALDKYTARIRDLLSEAIKDGDVREEVDPEVAALLVASVIQGLVNTWALSNCEFDLGSEYEAVWSILRRALVGGDSR